jgi:hypothetical protein
VPHVPTRSNLVSRIERPSEPLSAPLKEGNQLVVLKLELVAIRLDVVALRVVRFVLVDPVSDHLAHEVLLPELPGRTGAALELERPLCELPADKHRDSLFCFPAEWLLSKTNPPLDFLPVAQVLDGPRPFCSNARGQLVRREAHVEVNLEPRQRLPID